MINNLKEYNNLFTCSERKQLIANSLISLRKQYGYSQATVAQLIGVKTPAYATYESGRNEPKSEMLVRLSILYSVPVDLILQRDATSKDLLTEKAKAEEYENSIKELRKLLENKDPNTREVLTPLIDKIDDLTKAINKQLEEKEKNKSERE